MILYDNTVVDAILFLVNDIIQQYNPKRGARNFNNSFTNTSCKPVKSQNIKTKRLKGDERRR